jgi:hypothetical protein
MPDIRAEQHHWQHRGDQIEDMSARKVAQMEEQI